MIIIFSSLGGDAQSLLLRKYLKLLNHQSVIIDTHYLYKSGISFGINNGIKTCFIDGKEINVRAIIFSTHPRIDATSEVPRSVTYPTEWRLRLGWFFKEFCDFFREKTYFPSSLSGIDAMESKMNLLYEADKIGLFIPELNLISFGRANLVGDVFQKPLGFPFCITNKKGDKREKDVTVYGGISRKSSGEYPKFEQSAILAELHIRCVATQEKVFAVARRVGKNEKGVDFRELNDIPDFAPIWNSYELSPYTESKIKTLLKKHRLSWACPEFLLNKKKEYFIDLNPCGDWHGFFQKNKREEIAKHLIGCIALKIK